jgi:hypothetical protein
MKIQGFQPTQNAASYTQSSKVSTPATSAAAAPGTSDVYSGERATRAIEIMAGQDLGNISRNELKALTSKLYDAGVITSEQRLDLNMPNLDQLNAQMGYPVSNPDEKTNFLAELGAMLDAAKRLRPSDTSSIAYLEKVNNLANSLAAVSG